MGALALVTTLIGAIVTIIDGITDCCIQLSKLKLKIGACRYDTKKEDGMGECSVVTILVALASFPGPCLAFHCLECSVVLVKGLFFKLSCT